MNLINQSHYYYFRILRSRTTETRFAYTKISCKYSQQDLLPQSRGESMGTFVLLVQTKLKFPVFVSVMGFVLPLVFRSYRCYIRIIYEHDQINGRVKTCSCRLQLCSFNDWSFSSCKNNDSSVTLLLKQLIKADFVDFGNVKQRVNVQWVEDVPNGDKDRPMCKKG